MASGKRAKVINSIWQVFRPRLLANGFKRVASAHAYRDHERTIDVIKIEFFDVSSHRIWGTSSHSFGISCGVFLKDAPNPFGGKILKGADGSLEPDVTVCAIRSQLLRSMCQSSSVPKNVWAVPEDLTGIDAIADDALQALEGSGLKWFEQFSSLGKIVALLLSADEIMVGDAACFGFGRKGSPVRNLYLGFAAAAAGDRIKALEALEAASKSGFEKLSGSQVVDDMIVEKLAELRRASP